MKYAQTCNYRKSFFFFFLDLWFQAMVRFRLELVVAAIAVVADNAIVPYFACSMDPLCLRFSYLYESKTNDAWFTTHFLYYNFQHFTFLFFGWFHLLLHLPHSLFVLVFFSVPNRRQNEIYIFIYIGRSIKEFVIFKLHEFSLSLLLVLTCLLPFSDGLLHCCLS